MLENSPEGFFKNVFIHSSVSYEFLSSTLLDQLNVSVLFCRFIDLHDVNFFSTHTNQNGGHMCAHAPVHAAFPSTFPLVSLRAHAVPTDVGRFHRRPHAVVFSRCLCRLRHVLRYFWQVVQMRAVSGFCSRTLTVPTAFSHTNCSCHPCCGEALCSLFTVSTFSLLICLIRHFVSHSTRAGLQIFL